MNIEKSKICIGIISYFPDNQDVREVRISRLKNLLDKLKINLPDINIVIIAQNGNNEIHGSPTLEIRRYNDKLGITSARENLRQGFIKSDYEWIICFDDDFELKNNPQGWGSYLTILNESRDCFIEYDNYLMNMCAISKYMFKKYSFDELISAEKGTGFEDGIYVSMIRYLEPKRYKKIRGLNLPEKPRKDLVDDKYSTGITSSVDKKKLNELSFQIISKYKTNVPSFL